MTEQQRQFKEAMLRNFYLSIHLTVILEDDFLKRLGGKRELEAYCDELLDRINKIRLEIGLLKK